MLITLLPFIYCHYFCLKQRLIEMNKSGSIRHMIISDNKYFINHILLIIFQEKITNCFTNIQHLFIKFFPLRFYESMYVQFD